MGELRTVLTQITAIVHQVLRIVNHIQALAIRYELVRVMDEFMEGICSFKLHPKPNQLPDLVNGNLVQLTDGSLVCRSTNDESEKLRLATEFSSDGERLLKDGCEAALHENDPEFRNLSKALLERLKRPRKLNLQGKLKLVQDFQRLEEAMERVCKADEEVEERPPERFFRPYRDDLDTVKLLRAERLLAKVKSEFGGSYANFLSLQRQPRTICTSTHRACFRTAN